MTANESRQSLTLKTQRLELVRGSLLCSFRALDLIQNSTILPFYLNSTILKLPFVRPVPNWLILSRESQDKKNLDKDDTPNAVTLNNKWASLLSCILSWDPGPCAQPRVVLPLSGPIYAGSTITPPGVVFISLRGSWSLGVTAVQLPRPSHQLMASYRSWGS